MEELHTVRTEHGYAIIGIDPETRIVRWVEPTENKQMYTTRQAAHRRREQLEGKIMNAQLMKTLDAFLQSSDFKDGVISSTKAGWNGGSYKVELFPEGTWRVLWSNEIGNLYESRGIILTLPELDFDPSERDEYVDGGAGSEEEYLEELFYNEEQEIVDSLKESLSDKS